MKVLNILQNVPCVYTHHKSDLIGAFERHLHSLVILPTLFRPVLSVSKESESHCCSDSHTNDELLGVNFISTGLYCGTFL